MKYILAFFVLIVTACSLSRMNYTYFEINKAYRFSEFNKAGTTASIRVNYMKIKDKTDIKEMLTKDQLDGLNLIIGSLKPKKHHQQKIVGIERGVEIWIMDERYYLILTQRSLIDVSREFEYNLTKSQYENIQLVLEGV